jgi:hypothetical protein
VWKEDLENEFGFGHAMPKFKYVLYTSSHVEGNFSLKFYKWSQALWLKPVILATWEVKTGRITVQQHPWLTARDPISKITRAK